MALRSTIQRRSKDGRLNAFYTPRPQINAILKLMPATTQMGGFTDPAVRGGQLSMLSEEYDNRWHSLPVGSGFDVMMSSEGYVCCLAYGRESCLEH